MKCSACKFAVEQPLAPNSLQRTFLCKRFPPTATKLPGPQGLLLLVAHPVMQPDDYCHEFAPAAADA